MFFAENLKRTFHVCPRSVNSDGVGVFDKPIEYRASCYNALPTSASADLVTVGTSYFEALQIQGDPEYLRNIRPFDKVYVGIEPPVVHDPLAKGANFYVKGVTEYPNCTRILLRSLTTEADPYV
jgi:hypothetical protein